MEEEKLMKMKQKGKKREKQRSGGAKISAPTLKLKQELSQLSLTELTQST